MSESRTPGDTPIEIAGRLPCWTSLVNPEPLHGGITNASFVVRDSGDTFVVRIGDDLPLHGIVRDHELAACLAAHRCGLSPEIVHHQPGAMVMRFIEGRTLTPEDIRRPDTLPRVLDLIRRCHTEMPQHLRGANLMFSVFQACRNYITTAADDSGRLAGLMAELAECNASLEKATGPIRPVYCHNDLLAANFLDDGESIWLLDWEYAGWNSALFDLANLASNNGLTRDQETWLLETYFDRPAEPSDLGALNTLRCASLLRETLWSVVQEHHSELDFDYESYTDAHLDRFRTAYASLEIPS
jgi:thiamine kinase-like enzyme